MGNSRKTIVHTTPLCITLDNQDQVLFETNQDTWKSQSTKLFYSTTKNREMTDRLSRNLKLLKNYSMMCSSDRKVQAKVEPTCPSRSPLHCWTARWGCTHTLGWCRGTTSESGSHRILGENICRRKIFEEEQKYLTYQACWRGRWEPPRLLPSPQMQGCLRLKIFRWLHL